MSEITEADVLEALVPRLQEEGYTVYLHPTRLQVPPFFKDYEPDAIALRADKKLAIEIALRQAAEKSDRLPRIAKMFEGRPDKWELRVYWGSGIAPPDPLEVQTPDAIRARIAEVRTLGASGHLGPALLLGWATFEALGRASMSHELGRPQSPGRLVEILAREGYVTPTEADRLRQLADKRNKLAHDELQVRVTEEEIQTFAAVLDTLLGLLGTPTASERVG